MSADVRQALEAAGYPALANDVAEWGHVMGEELPEFRALLERLAAMESAVRAAGRLLEGKAFALDDPQARTLAAALRLLEEDDDDA